MVLWELHLWLWELNFGLGNGNIVELMSMVLWELHLWLWELNFGFGNGNIVDLNEYGALGIASLALGMAM